MVEVKERTVGTCFHVEKGGFGRQLTRTVTDISM